MFVFGQTRGIGKRNAKSVEAVSGCGNCMRMRMRMQLEDSTVVLEKDAEIACACACKIGPTVLLEKDAEIACACACNLKIQQWNGKKMGQMNAHAQDEIEAT